MAIHPSTDFFEQVDPREGIRAVVIGGGTGTFTVLSSLKHYVNDITAIVNMVDDGGSTGVLRDELGVLPPGDVRQCLVALSNAPEEMRELFNYRFPEGSFGGHSFGNILLTALEKTTGNFADAVRAASHILNVEGSVVPVTTDNVRLRLKFKSGKVIRGEGAIDQSFFKASDGPFELSLDPGATINPEAKEAIKQADLIVFGPGNFYASLIPTLLVDGMPEALRRTRAKKVYVCNLVTKPGQTDGFKVHTFLDEVERYIGKSTFEYLIYNTARPPERLLKKYAKAGERWVEFDETHLGGRHYEAVGEDLISPQITKKDPNDTLQERTLIRHDSERLARLLMRLYFS
jgi:uncharacterized cofD-like protein